MKLRGQLASEKPAQDGGSDVEDFDAFSIFRLIGSVLLAVFVRLFVCKFLVSLVAPLLLCATLTHDSAHTDTDQSNTENLAHPIERFLHPLDLFHVSRRKVI